MAHNWPTFEPAWLEFQEQINESANLDIPNFKRVDGVYRLEILVWGAFLISDQSLWDPIWIEGHDAQCMNITKNVLSKLVFEFCQNETKLVKNVQKIVKKNLILRAKIQIFLFDVAKCDFFIVIFKHCWKVHLLACECQCLNYHLSLLICLLPI